MRKDADGNDMIMDVCQGPNCNREMEHPEKSERWFCSIECACYAGAFSVKDGWLDPKEKK